MQIILEALNSEFITVFAVIIYCIKVIPEVIEKRRRFSSCGKSKL